jgi:hypothetical protein
VTTPVKRNAIKETRYQSVYSTKENLPREGWMGVARRDLTRKVLAVRLGFVRGWRRPVRTVFLVDDHEVVRRGVVDLLDEGRT